MTKTLNIDYAEVSVKRTVYKTGENEYYINNEKFMAYYMTVSGHLNYTKIGNCMVDRNWDLVKDLAYTDKAKSYIAANIELDKAIGELLKNLDYVSVREKTTIEQVQALTDKPVKCVVDPVFLHTKEEWIEMLNSQLQEQEE